ncbi:MAG: gamma-glutamyl-gamma-aminobutyrate hydrolase family protein [candidate division WOR-3 bacterium]|nr:gamma-glutamyl-gamma-aminobutyrate hydrolase family protein [candidate division WOR-3 bacterium]
MRTLIIDCYLPNSPQIEHLYKVISEITTDVVEIKDASSIGVEEDVRLYNAIIISGSQRKLAEIGTFELYANVAELVKRCEKPILGICFGHQLIAKAYYEDIVPMGQKIEGYYMVKKVNHDELFDGLPEKFLVMEGHEEMVKNLPYEFIHLAESPNCPIEAIRHRVLPIYGVQFHPERFDDKHPAGEIILENFFKIASFYIK